MKPIVTDAQAATMRARADAATPGPWHTYPDLPTLVEQSPNKTVAGCSNDGLGKRGTADAQFIAASRTDIPSLLDTRQQLVEALRHTLNHYSFNKAECNECAEAQALVDRMGK